MIQENAKPATPMQSIVRLPMPFEPYYSENGITIYNADCRKILPWMERFDLLLTDPPYGIGADKKKAHRTIRDNPDWENSDWDAKRPARWVLESMCEFAKTQIIRGGNYFSDSLPPSQCWLVWDKGQREFSLADAELAWTSMDKAVRAFDCPRSRALQDGKVHPTQKPAALMKWCLGLVPDAKTVLDPFMGSGTTLVASKLEGRQAIGIEINEAYCEAAAKRLSQGTLF
jgi:site-specific DNA-methyltransferase (adenine-specific)